VTVVGVDGVLRPLGDETEGLALRRLLAEAGLTLEGFDAIDGPLLVVVLGGEVVGGAAVERWGAAGLLRSVVVAEPLRGRGVGSLLVGAAIEAARAAGLDELYLLTETADDWFPRFGFAPVAREDLPAALGGSAELRGACPESAMAMRLALTRGA